MNSFELLIFLYNSKMVEIRPLKSLDFNRFHQLASGYVSHQTYVVTKNETPEGTTLSIKLEPLAQPYKKLWKTDPEMERFYLEILDQGYSLGLFMEDQLIGVAIAEKREWNRTFWVWEFHIDPNYQQQGFGHQLMDRLADIGRQANCRVMVCETQNTNVPAIQFYRQLGFEIGGFDLSYYTNADLTDFEVAIFMKRYLE